MKSQSQQTALTSAEYAAGDIEKSRAHRGARLHHTYSARLLDDEPAVRTIVRICEIKRLIQSRSNERLEIDRYRLRRCPQRATQNHHNDGLQSHDSQFYSVRFRWSEAFAIIPANHKSARRT